MIEIRELNKTFHLENSDVEAVRDLSLTIDDGVIYGVIGSSGAGKSTLVRCLNLLEIPDSGTIRIDGVGEIELRNGKPWLNGKRMTAREQNNMRRGIGMIFQHFNLLDRCTVFENVAYPLQHTGRSRKQIEKRVCELLTLVGLEDKTNVYPSQLSGGQKQRVAIARALAAEPRILLSDEATSALDPEATEAILSLLQAVNRQLGVTIVLITHEMAVIKSIADRVAVMENGRVVEEGTVYDIFADPQKEITRKFVSTSSLLGKLDKLLEENAELIRVKPGEMLVRLMFRKDCVGEHLLTTAARKYGFDLNIILANSEYLHGSPIGGMVGIISGEQDHIEEGLEFLRQNHVSAEVIRDGRTDAAGHAESVPVS
ncbi:MAG: ATP-binding cassette domain-containing protein [Clostridia bacterium]|nr:ATP-binding cassette domain-containing protein [Clostridia bacterium]